MRPASLAAAQAPARGAGSESSSAVRLAGEWTAEVTYARNATHMERFTFKLDGNEVLGTASFLGVGRGIQDGTLNGDRVLFTTTTQVCTGDCSDAKNLEHRYRGRISGDVITFSYTQIQEGRSDVPIEFTAKRGQSLLCRRHPSDATRALRDVAVATKATRRESIGVRRPTLIADERHPVPCPSPRIAQGRLRARGRRQPCSNCSLANHQARSSRAPRTCHIG